MMPSRGRTDGSHDGLALKADRPQPPPRTNKRSLLVNPSSFQSFAREERDLLPAFDPRRRPSAFIHRYGAPFG